MNERFQTAMSDPRVAKDTKLLGDFAVIFCDATHAERKKHALESDGARLGVYGRTAPVVCDECAELLRYAEKRRAFCPKDPKPFCTHCDTHCYRPDMRAYMCEVMRYAGPRSMWHGHAIDGVKHLIEGRRYKRELKARAASDTES